MQNIKSLFILALLFTATVARGQNEAIIQQYIQTYKELAIQEMQRTGVPAAIKLAQGIHETSAGTSNLVTRSNNHFGIKCKETWRGATVRHTDDAPNECFRKYDQPLDSYRDHSDFLRASSRYAFLFSLDPLDYEGWAHGLKKAGYATNPKYPQVIIKLIKDYNLQDFTLIALNKKQESDMAVYTSKKTSNSEITATPAVLIEESVNVKKQETKYPQGEFSINNTRVIFVSKGTSFLAIAQDYNVPLARIFEFNDLPQAEVLNKDQLIFLQRKRKTGNDDYHVVKAGENLYDIAQVQAIRLESLLEYNSLKAGAKPQEGEKLLLRPKTAQTAMSSTK